MELFAMLNSYKLPNKENWFILMAYCQNHFKYIQLKYFIITTKSHLLNNYVA